MSLRWAEETELNIQLIQLKPISQVFILFKQNQTEAGITAADWGTEENPKAK